MCWPNILTGTCIKLPRKAEYPHQKYSDIEAYTKEYLLPRYCDTIKFSADQFPGACHCLAGIVVTFGLGYLIQDVNTLQNVICFCLRQQDVHQQCQGLGFLTDIIHSFKALIEPYIPVFIQDILFLNSSENEIIVNLSKQIMLLQLRSVSQFGIQHIVSIILDALDEENDWKLIYGAADFVYAILCNSAKLPVSQFRAMLTKLIPQLLPKLQMNIYHPQKEVKDIVVKAISKVAELVQSPIIRAISKNIVNAYIDPDLSRNVLIDITELQFTQHIDAASVTLIYPICEKILKRDSAIQLTNAYDRMKNMHIKTIAASVLSLLSEITSVQDFLPFISQIKNILIQNLAETNDDIRKACAIALAKIVSQQPKIAYQIQQELRQMLKRPQISIALAHGLSLAIVNISFQLNNWEQLLSDVSEIEYLKLGINDMFVYVKCPKCGAQEKVVISSEDIINVTCSQCKSMFQYQVDSSISTAEIIHVALYLLYIPQMLIDLNDNQLNEQFAKSYFDQCFSQVISLVRMKQLFKENQKLILSIARQLATSFLTTRFNCQIIGRQLINAIVDQSYEVREMAISLVGDVISEIGSTVIEKSNKQETDELKEIRKALNEIRVTGIAEEKTVKVFIPEKAIAYAM